MLTVAYLSSKQNEWVQSPLDAPIWGIRITVVWVFAENLVGVRVPNASNTTTRGWTGSIGDAENMMQVEVDQRAS